MAFEFQYTPSNTSSATSAGLQMAVNRRKNRIEDENLARQNAFSEVMAKSIDPQTGEMNVQNAFIELGRRGMGAEAVALRDSIAKNELAKAQIQKQTLSDWQKPGWLQAQKALAEAKGEGKMSPAAQKELFEADETIQASKNAMGLLNEALRLNSKAYSGPFANERIVASRVLPGKYEGADAATSLDNIVRGQALESLKAIFGGMPTEGERKILIDLQGSLEKTPEQREDIFKRAAQAAERRLKFNEEKAKSLRSGNYFKAGPNVDPAPQRTGQTEDVGQQSNKPKRKVGDIVQTKNGKMIIMSVNPDGTYEATPAK